MSTQTPHQLLLAARQRISDPARWTTGANARQANGLGTTIRDAHAVCWCAAGALMLEADNSTVLARAEELLSKHSFQNNSRDFVSTNDGMGHRAILEVFDLAIREAAQSPEATKPPEATESPEVLPPPPRWTLRKLRLNAQGYEYGTGYYFGLWLGNHVYHAERDTDSLQVHASSREAAKAKVRETYPSAKFFR